MHEKTSMRPVTEPLPRIKPGRGGTQGDRQVQIFKSTTAAATMLTVGGGEGVVAWRRRVAAGRGQTVRPSVRPGVAGSGDTQWWRRSRRRPRPNNIIAEKEEREERREKIIDLCDMD